MPLGFEVSLLGSEGVGLGLAVFNPRQGWPVYRKHALSNTLFFSGAACLVYKISPVVLAAPLKNKII